VDFGQFLLLFCLSQKNKETPEKEKQTTVVIDENAIDK